MDKEIKSGTKGTETMSSQEYILIYDGTERLRGTGDQCRAKLVSLQGPSTPPAMKNECWTISPVNPITRLIDAPKEIPLYLE